MTTVAFAVHGIPAPQGSKRIFRGRLVEASKKLPAWREVVAYTALIHRPPQPLDGPLYVFMVFTMPRPMSTPKRHTQPDKRPDLSKLLRSTEDSLTTARVWADDARVVEYRRAAKVWAGYDKWGLNQPGVLIAVSDDPDADLAVAALGVVCPMVA